MSPFLSTACVFHIVHEITLYFIGPVCTFITIKSCSKFLFCFTNINELLQIFSKLPPENTSYVTLSILNVSQQALIEKCLYQAESRTRVAHVAHT